MGIKHAFQSAKANGSDATQVQPSNWNADHTVVGEFGLPANATPATPAAGNVNLFGKDLANRVFPAAVGPSGMDYSLQPAIWRQKIMRWNAPGGATTVPGVDGFAAMTVTGTATARTVATTNLLTRMRRLAYVSVATAAGICAVRGAAVVTGGNATPTVGGGFFQSIRFAASDAAAVAGARMFVGVDSAAFTNVEPNTRTNCFGVAQLSTDSTQLYLVYGGSAAQTAIALGTGFPIYNGTVGITTGVPYDLTIWSPPHLNGVFNYRLDRLDTGTFTSGTITPTVVGTQTPAGTTLLAASIARTNNATALAVGMDVSSIYVETDY